MKLVKVYIGIGAIKVLMERSDIPLTLLHGKQLIKTSEMYKAMKKKQLPHTCSRKGDARLAEEMRKSSSDPSSVTGVALWTKAHKRRDGEPVNSQVAETLESLAL
ncbi:uncharacterized protein E5676_scaffold383G00200 [Cucumis melo var. makuwa]|uniref:Uncharacterized protein n=1 Tax=Cucumis melo var. makuwa TaxID=1194695 RepID=A0A5D3CAN4_CUCMM|nr:uncharacterized protein E6C27_scaffold163G001200 [Cucumis melo var. makuwa]TYK08911.1 uncharacterized protein E5676_scaffold383G00200 [Cucumis melo var. makuwa]